MRARILYIALVVSGLAASARADRAEEIARIHIAAMGGRERIAALSALEVMGHAETRSGRIEFRLLAARPNRLRMESRLAARTIVQVTNGTPPSWQWAAGEAKPPQRLSAADAEMLALDADFDDPLVSALEGRGRLENGGEVTVGGRRLLRVLVVRSLVENVFVLVDPATFLIVKRVHHLRHAGRPVQVEFDYADFRPVAGVLLPHAVRMLINGALSQRAVFDRITPNPPLGDEMFAPPR